MTEAMRMITREMVMPVRRVLICFRLGRLTTACSGRGNQQVFHYQRFVRAADDER